MAITLIPFGIDRKTGMFVDVANVPNGRKCNCICPLCNLSLVARQGDKNRWHFAHDPTDPMSENVISLCKYSFFTSIRMMAQQMADSFKTLNVPRLEFHGSHDDAIKVSADSVEINAIFCGTTFDVLIHSGSFRLYIFFSHDERCFPSGVSVDDGEKVGVLEINIGKIKYILENDKVGVATDILFDLVVNEIFNKHWRFHPKKTTQKYHNATHLSTRKRPDDTFDGGFLSISQPQNKTFECRACNAMWSGTSPADRHCKKCNTHVYIVDHESNGITKSCTGTF